MSLVGQREEGESAQTEMPDQFKSVSARVVEILIYSDIFTT